MCQNYRRLGQLGERSADTPLRSDWFVGTCLDAADQPVTDTPPTRRASYGPTSPTVGERGTRTRSSISDAALAVFAETGYHAATVDEIARRAQVSRATFYQYFATKDEAFVDLMRRSGSALAEVNRGLQRLGPHAEGYSQLRTWLDGWGEVFAHYTPIFVEWTHVDTPRAFARSPSVEFTDIHTRYFVRAMEADGSYAHGDPATMAKMALAMVSRTHYSTHLYETGLTDLAIHDSLAVAIQCTLFPNTPDAVLSDTRPGQERARGSDVVVQPRSPLPSSDAPRRRLPETLGPRSATTARRLVDAAGRVFADHGFLAANVDLIVIEAGVARGTFYRYFDDKTDLLAILADEAAEATTAPLRRLADPAVHGDPIPLRAEIAALRSAHATYAGVVKAWAETTALDAAVMAPCGDVIRAVAGSVIAMFGDERGYPLDRRAAGIIWSAVIEHFPNQVQGTTNEPDGPSIVETQAAFVERVLLRR